jgi:hypothetical protein
MSANDLILKYSMCVGVMPILGSCAYNAFRIANGIPVSGEDNLAWMGGGFFLGLGTLFGDIFTSDRNDTKVAYSPESGYI